MDLASIQTLCFNIPKENIIHTTRDLGTQATSVSWLNLIMINITAYLLKSLISLLLAGVDIDVAGEGSLRLYQ